MVNKLPDELVKLILEPLLHVSEEYFSSFETDENSPFGREIQSSARVLSVCKSWLRVGTPLLYHTVVIRTTVQARCLASVLKATPALGRFVHRMRIEGGIGAPFGPIFAAAQGVQELHLSLTHLARVAPAKFCQGLLTLNPRRVALILASEGVALKISKAGDAILNCLKECFGLWPQMETFAFSRTSYQWGDSVPQITETLCRSNSLKQVFIRDHLHADAFAVLAASKSLESLVLVQQESNASGIKIQLSGIAPELKALIRVECDCYFLYSKYWWRNPVSLEVRNASPKPEFHELHEPLSIDITSQLDDNIWSRIIKFFFQPPCPDDAIETLAKRLTRRDTKVGWDGYERADDIFCLSKRFLRLARPIYYRAPTIDSKVSLLDFHALVSKNAQAASAVQALTIEDLSAYYDADFSPMVVEVLAHLPNLKHLMCRLSLTLKDFEAIAQTQGDTLEFLCYTVKPSENPSTTKKVGVPALSFPKLRTLLLRPPYRFTEALPKMETPMLKKLHLEESFPNINQFLQQVGGSLEELTLSTALESCNNVLDACPNLKALHIEMPYLLILALKDSWMLRHRKRHTNLTTLTFDFSTTHGRDLEKLSPEFCTFIEALDLSKCVALRTVKLHKFRFSTTEAGLRKTQASDRIPRLFVERHGLTVYDGEGTLWRNIVR